MDTKSKKFQYRVLEATQGNHQLLSFFAPAKELLKCVSINQKDEDEDEGYQRIASPARTGAIARYVDAGNPLPLSILITLERRHINLDGDELTISANKKSGWVIDGQHRLIGATKASTAIELPVIAFVGLSLADQISQFVTINKEAKGVPSSLYLSLLKKLPTKLSPADAAKERAADVGMLLRNDEESPFAQRIVVTTAPGNGQLSLVNFVRKVGPLVRPDNGLLGAYTLQEQSKIIANYYVAIKNTFPREFASPNSVFFQTIGFGALMNFFPIAFSATLSSRKAFTVADVTHTLKTISHIDVDQWKKAGTGNAAETTLGNDLVEEFRALAVSGGTDNSIKLS